MVLFIKDLKRLNILVDFLSEKTHQNFMHEIMNTQTGLLRLTYNAACGHYAFHWQSNCGSFVEDDEGEVHKIVENFKGDVNNPNWFIEKAESELDFAIEEGDVKKGDNWRCTWLMEGGYIEDWWFNQGKIYENGIRK